MSPPEVIEPALLWQHNRPGLTRPCPNRYVRIGSSCPTCGRVRLEVDSGHGQDMAMHGHGQARAIRHSPAVGPRHVYLDADEVRWIDQLGISNVSAYLRSKLEEDARSVTPLKGLRAELETKREEVRRLEQTFEGKALETEEALQLFEVAAKQARKVIAGSPKPMQTTLLGWIHNHPTAQKLREVLPADFDDNRLMDVLLRWPESKTEVQLLVETQGGLT